MDSDTPTPEQHEEDLALLNNALEFCNAFALTLDSFDSTEAKELLERQVQPVINIARSIVDKAPLTASAVHDFLPSAMLFGHTCFVYNKILRVNNALISTQKEIPDMISLYAVVVRFIANDVFSLRDNHNYRPIIETTVENLDRLTTEWTERIEFTRSSGFPDEFMGVLPVLRDLSKICSQHLRSIISACPRELNSDDDDDETRNVFKDINMGDDTILALLSPQASGTFNRIRSGKRSMQILYIDDSKQDDEVDIEGKNEELMKVFSSERSQAIIAKCLPGFSLMPVETNSLEGIVLEEGEVMLFLSSCTPVKVKNVQGKAGSILLAGGITLPLIQKLADLFKVEFDSEVSDGIFKVVRRDSLG